MGEFLAHFSATSARTLRRLQARARRLPPVSAEGPPTGSSGRAWPQGRTFDQFPRDPMRVQLRESPTGPLAGRRLARTGPHLAARSSLMALLARPQPALRAPPGELPNDTATGRARQAAGAALWRRGSRQGARFKWPIWSCERQERRPKQMGPIGRP